MIGRDLCTEVLLISDISVPHFVYLLQLRQLRSNGLLESDVFLNLVIRFFIASESFDNGAVRTFFIQFLTKQLQLLFLLSVVFFEACELVQLPLLFGFIL